MRSARLTYHPVTEAGLDDFHRLVEDEHVRRYLASVRVLRKLGFREVAVREGSFGAVLVMELAPNVIAR